jgi:hypothetical protein
MSHGFSGSRVIPLAPLLSKARAANLSSALTFIIPRPDCPEIDAAILWPIFLKRPIFLKIVETNFLSIVVVSEYLQMGGIYIRSISRQLPRALNTFEHV